MSEVPAPRILIVDDNEDDALLLRVELGRIVPGAAFERVDNEKELRRVLAESDWDLVICDHSMPQFDSTAALRVMRECARDVPFVIYSGQLDERAALDAMRRGAQDFVNKHDPARLVPVVERELRNAELRRAKRAADSSIIPLSNYDALTHLPNRHSLMETMQTSLEEAGCLDLAPALFVLDLDRFMRINDSFGYAMGDALMRQVALRLLALAGPGAMVARLGQDEFAIFLPRNPDLVAARLLSERLARDLAQPFALPGQELFITVSGGVVLFPEHGADPATLLKNAECTMFSARQKGGNRIEFYERRINHDAGHRLRLENALRRTIARDELFVLYQPIVELVSGRAVAMEALVRWRHPEFGVIPPDEFIPLAEEIGFIAEVGEWVLLSACRQTRRWRKSGHSGLAVAVNFSADQFQRDGAAERVLGILRESALEPEALELEITESVAMRDAHAAVATLQSLKATGARIAIDDFGTGMSSLAYLKRFPIDILKIDKSFVRGLPGGEDDAAIASMIAVLGQSLGLTVHAEGVETAEQGEFLRCLGCHRIQGYHVAAPLRVEEVPAFLTARKVAAHDDARMNRIRHGHR